MIENLSKASPKRLAIKVKPAAERMIRKEHPWIFEEAIVKQNADGNPGDLAIIYDQKKNKFMALGLYDPHSVIRVKLLQFKTPAQIDQQWFKTKIEGAYATRNLLLQTDTNSYRLLHGENDGLPGLIADVYAQVLVVKLYTAIWPPYLHKILPILQQTSTCTCIVLRLSRSLQKTPELLPGLHDGQVIFGKLEQETVIFKEHGLLFSANVIHGHKTGYFLDHRHNRHKVGTLAKGQRVLDVFAYAGGFSVHALAGGAKEVISLDISAQALEMAKRNVQLNFAEANHKIMAIDAFEGLQKLHQQDQQFDLIVVDPPSFAKRESEVEKALHSYHRLAQLAVRLVAPGGTLVLASCSSRVTADAFFTATEQALQASGRSFQETERTFHDVDHPIGFPEGAYLKCGYYKFA